MIAILLISLSALISEPSAGQGGVSSTPWSTGEWVEKVSYWRETRGATSSIPFSNRLRHELAGLREWSEAGALPFHNGEFGLRDHGHRLYLGGSREAERGLPPSMVLEEFMMDTSIAYAGCPYSQFYPSAAFDGTNYLVVWGDMRGGSYLDIYAARVDTAGAVLDILGLPISTADRDQSCPSVAFGGTNYLVVWIDERSGIDQLGIYATRVDQTGTVLDSSGILIHASAAAWTPSVAFDGTNYLVVWTRWRSGPYDIYGARVSQSGVVLDPYGIPISVFSGHQRSASVAFDGTNYLVVWEDERAGSGECDIYGARIDTSGTVLEPFWGIPIFTAAHRQECPSLAFDGTNYLVVWLERYGDDIYGTRVDTSGMALDPSGIAICIDADWQQFPSVAFDETNYLVVWQNYYGGDIHGARVDTSGAVLDPSGIAIGTVSSLQFSPSVASDGVNQLVVWSDFRSDLDWDIYGARVDPAGMVLDTSGVIISTAPYSQLDPSAASGETEYLVVWEDRRRGSHIYGTRVASTGMVLDPRSIRISTATRTHQWFPSVAFDETNYFVVWTDWFRYPGSADIWGARVTQSGVVLDPLGIPVSTISSGQWCPSAAFDGTNYLVVWEDNRHAPQWDIYGARIDPATGAVLDPSGIAICTDTFDQWSTSVAFDGTNYLVVWQDYRSSGSWDIYGTRVDPSTGAVLDPSGIAVVTAYRHQVSPSVAFDGRNYLVVWQDQSCRDIYGVRVEQSGRVLPPSDPLGIPISTASGWQSEPSVAFDGTNYLVVWEDWRNGYDGDIYGARVDTSGTVLDPSGIELINKPYNRVCPAVAGGPGSQLLLVYQGFAPEPYGSQRILGALYGGSELARG